MRKRKIKHFKPITATSMTGTCPPPNWAELSARSHINSGCLGYHHVVDRAKHATGELVALADSQRQMAGG